MLGAVCQSQLGASIVYTGMQSTILAGGAEESSNCSVQAPSVETAKAINSIH